MITKVGAVAEVRAITGVRATAGSGRWEWAVGGTLLLQAALAAAGGGQSSRADELRTVSRRLRFGVGLWRVP
ncbi:hypothetical protein [Micromonospora sp. NBC_00362]|uniref:hypothetical protein n=1 Tax=Micromonospora sp. NBC_00362 TaxID=2975975 RepID=UPI00225BC4F0|nr:hypothetical protein [Micromonospora sp. NBC_00362]